MTATTESDLHRPDTTELDGLCRTVFEPIARSDQRRWATAYVHGLVHVPGRKSLRRISELVAGDSTEQCLQQFVNQSPWNWAPVRQVLARTAEPALAPRAWAVQELDFPKRGRYSVGVGTQYVPGARRTFNCQLGMALWMAGDGGSVPVNWRLMLPSAWDDDEPRRQRVRLPDTERSQAPWEHILSCVDEAVESWDLAPRPVVADRRHDPQTEMLVRGLEERGLRYAVRISENTPVSVAGGRRRPVRAGDLMRSAAAHQIALPERAATGTSAHGRSSPLVAHVVVATGCPARPALHVPIRPRRLLARWPRGRSRPGELWFTNLGMAPLPELLGLLDIPERLTAQSQRLRRDCGLDHFEGRSFRGWHHHVTLASVAHAHQTIGDTDRTAATPC